MKINWLRVVRDVAILLVLIAIGGFVGAFGILDLSPWASRVCAGTTFGTLGFCLSGCLTPKNRWKHLLVVALVLWLTNWVALSLFMAWFNPVRFSQFGRPDIMVGGIFAVAVMMLAGAGLSELFVPAREQENVQVDKRESGQDG